MPNLATSGEDIVEKAKGLGPIQLPKPRHDCTKHKQSIYQLFKATLNKEGQKLVDVETLIMLCSAMTAFKEPAESIRLVFYDALLLYETLGWTIPGWQQMVSQYPETPHLDDAKLVASDEVPQELLVKAFRHLDQGGTVTSLVTELGMTTGDAKLAGKEYYALQGIQPRSIPKAEARASPAEEHLRDLKVDVEIAELERKKEELERPVEEARQLALLRPILNERGTERQLSCQFFHKDHCSFNRWHDKPDSIHAEGEPVQKGKWWHICPKPVSCVVCGNYQDKGFPTPSEMLARI
jgi:hypothetical protein